MPIAALERPWWEEGVEHERHAAGKSQFFEGEHLGMAGGSANHRLVATNLCGEAGNALKSRNGRVYGSDTRVHCPYGLGTDPDASIVFGEPQFQGEGQETRLNPVVIVEVVPPGTEGDDRGKKFEHDQSLHSLQDYVTDCSGPSLERPFRPATKDMAVAAVDTPRSGGPYRPSGLEHRSDHWRGLRHGDL